MLAPGAENIRACSLDPLAPGIVPDASLPGAPSTATLAASIEEASAGTPESSASGEAGDPVDEHPVTRIENAAIRSRRERAISIRCRQRVGTGWIEADRSVGHHDDVDPA